MAAAYETEQTEPLCIAFVRIVAYWKKAHKMDPDNLIATMKSAIDGITDAGIWIDDRELSFLPCVQDKDADNPRIEIHVFRSLTESEGE